MLILVVGLGCVSDESTGADSLILPNLLDVHEGDMMCANSKTDSSKTYTSCVAPCAPTSEKIHIDYGSMARLSSFRCIAITAVCVSTFVLSIMTRLAMNFIIPIIQRDLDIEFSNLQWLSNGFALGYGGVLLFTGRLADMYGHKLSLIVGLLIFAVSSLFCAISQDWVQLSIARTFSGIGAAVSGPALLGILGHFEPNTKAHTYAFTALLSGGSIGGAMGIVIGVSLNGQLRSTWRAFFYICLGFPLVVAIAAIFIVPADKLPKERERLDWIGAALIVTGSSTLLWSLSTSSRQRLYSLGVLGNFLGSLILMIAFVIWQIFLEKNHAKWGAPLMKMSLFKRPAFAAVQCIAALVCHGLWVGTYFLSIYFQTYVKLSLTETVIRFIPMVVVSMLLTPGIGYATNHWSGQLITLIGCLVASLSCLLMSLTDPEASYWTYSFFAIALTMSGGDMVFQAGTMYGSKISGPHEKGVAGSILLVFCQLGQSVGLCLATYVQVMVTRSKSLELDVTIENDLLQAPPSAYLAGLDAAFWVSFGGPAIATVISVLFLRPMGIMGSTKVPKEDKLSKATLKDNHKTDTV